MMLALTTLRARGRALPRPVRAALHVLGALVAWAIVAATLEVGAPPGYILRGLVVGSLYALSAIGIVLVYRANRVINFAQAELGSVAAVIAIELVIQSELNYFVAIGIGLAIAAALGALVDVAIIRRFRRAPRLILTVATIGIAQVLAGLALIIPLVWEGANAGRFITPFRASFTVSEIRFDANSIVILVVAPLAVAALAMFLRRSDYGVGVRAAAENEDRANLLGIPVRRLSTMVWALAATLSATAVLLRVPLVGFASFQGVSGASNGLLLRVLAAAVIGRMEHLPRTVVAALSIGIFDELASAEYSNTTYVDALLVVVILLSLLTQRDAFARSAETGISSFKAVREVRPIPDELRRLPEVVWGSRVLRVGLLACAASVPLWMSGSQQQASSYILIYAIVAVSLLVLTGWSGQISLGQFALVGFGGATTSVLYGRHGWDYLLAVPAGVAVAAAVAVVIGLPALRIRGPFLAVTTLAFAVTASTYLLEDQYFPWFIESRIDPPVLWGRIDLGTKWVFYEVCLVSLLVAIAAVRNIRSSRPGRAIIAVRDNEPAAQSVTIAPTRTKLMAFALSGGLAGLAGSLYVVISQGLATDAFDVDKSLRLFSMVVIGGLGSVPGAILGAIYVRSAEFFLDPQYALLASGAGILLLLLVLPEGLGGGMYRVRDMVLRRIAARRGLVVPSLLADRRTDDADPDDTAVAAGLLTDPATASDAAPEPVGASR
ncbi:MAG: ABC transporter permease [Acidimicrobiales bacterium]